MVNSPHTRSQSHSRFADHPALWAPLQWREFKIEGISLINNQCCIHISDGYKVCLPYRLFETLCLITPLHIYMSY